jgi:hypothetical protein
MMACGDGNFYVTRIGWTRWDARRAAGTGTGHLNDCRPDCARGHFHAYRVAVSLSAPVVCAGLNEFARIGWRFVATVPPGVTGSGSESFSCHWRKVRP